VTAIRHVLMDVAARAYVVPSEVVGLAAALDLALGAYAAAIDEPHSKTTRS
jgi:hypothetical protein